MAIQLDTEKKRKLSTQDMYDILHFAAQSAEDNGFINQFVYERALYAYAAVILYPDRKQELAEAISNNILDAWDALIEDGTVENMDKDFSIDMEELARNGSIWLTDYSSYLQSLRGVFSSFQIFSNDIVDSAVNRFKNTFNDNKAEEVLNILDKWGMNNNLENEKPKDTNKLNGFSIVENEKPKDTNKLNGFSIVENENIKEENADEDSPLFEL